MPADERTRFLLERYTAVTSRRGKGRMFHIAHDPWIATPIDVQMIDDRLVRSAAPWFPHAQFACAHHSPGVHDVEIGSPLRIETRPAWSKTREPGFRSWLPLLLLPILALLTKPLLPPWAWMWAIAFALFFGCKWATFRQAADLAHSAPRWKSLAYLLAWPGMDAHAFFAKRTHRPKPTQWILPIAKTLAGILILFTLPRLAVPNHPILAGWTGMTGLILALHFGLFELLALVWQAFGIDARSIMNGPWRSATLGEFWGLRWNRGFRDLSHGWLFRPLLPHLGPLGATYVTFAVSGLVHDLVISVPAGAGYFLPTLYFLFQAAGLLIEKTPLARRHLRGLPGRLFTIAFLVLPATLLFHSPFVLNVIVPFLRAIGAL